MINPSLDELDPAHFFICTSSSMASLFKIIEVQLELLTDVNMLLMVEKGIRGRICHAIYRYAKANNKCMKNYDENEKSSCLQFLVASNLYGWVMSQKLPVDGFKWKI